MKILALETSSEYCSVALWQDGAVMDRREQVGQKHSERLMVMLDDLLKEAGVALAQMDGLAFGKGPGSFTGVRIACGVTQGLALGAGLPVIGVCTLEALAQAAGHDQVIAVLDARMGEIYHAAYRRQGDDWAVLSEPSLCKPEQAPALAGADWFAAGSGFAVHGAALQARYAAQLLGVDGAAAPQACAVAALGAVRFARGEGVDAALALPLYLRDKVALTTGEREAARRCAP